VAFNFENQKKRLFMACQEFKLRPLEELLERLQRSYRAGVVNFRVFRAEMRLEEITKYCNLLCDDSKYFQLSHEDAFKAVLALVTRSMIDGRELISPEDVLLLIDDVFIQFGAKSSFYSNFEWNDGEPGNTQKKNDSVFDSGVIAISDGLNVCIWFREEEVKAG
jgi:hypothetical protein